MSKLDELIAEFCPNGVMFQALLEVADVLYGYPCDASKFNDEEIGMPLIRIRNVLIGKTDTYTTEQVPKDYIVHKGDLLVGMDGNFHTATWNDEDAFLCQRVCKIYSRNEDIILNRFLVHLLKPMMKKIEESKNSGTVKHLLAKDIKGIKIPVPPLEVQREIVHILDEFTLLSAELSAELQARKKQYEYYRDTLLEFDTKIPMVTLKDIATDIYRGAGIKRNQVTEEGTPCVRYGEIYTTYNTWFKDCVSHTKEEYISSPKYFEHGDILFAITGESVEDIAKSVAYLGNEKCLAGGDIVVLKHKQNPRYLAHVLSTTYARQQKSKGKVKSKVVHSNVPSIESITIPLPSLEVQERYADVLDNFETICNDLSIGLPAEIDARQKQYEYYRDVLLTFAETGDSILTDRQTDRQSIIKLLQYVFGYALVKLQDIATVSRGGNFQKSDFIDDGIPCIHYGQIYTGYGIYASETITKLSPDVSKKAKWAEPNDVVMAVTSENVEDVCKCVAWLGDEKVAVGGHTAIIHHNQNAKYLAYYFHTSMFFAQKRKLAHGTKVIEVTPDRLNDVVIPLPTEEKQEEIVKQLDRFDSLCNDISEGIPAEIEARQKQYEYYRDKLLEFNMIEVN